MMLVSIIKKAREKYQIDLSSVKPDGRISLPDMRSLRSLVQQINQKFDPFSESDKMIKASQLNGLALIDEIFRHVLALYQKEKIPDVFRNLLVSLNSEFGSGKVDHLLSKMVDAYPPLAIIENRITVPQFLAGVIDGRENKEQALENLILLWISTLNPALTPFAELLWDEDLVNHALLEPVMRHIDQYFSQLPGFGPENQSLIEMLQSPAKNVPNSIRGQLEYIREHWGFLLAEFLYRLLTSLDLAKEEEKTGFTGPGPVSIPMYDEDESSGSFDRDEEFEAFSEDRDWMPRLVLIAKNVFVWLDQLSKKYARPITTLDQIPDEELAALNRTGITGLWLIGLWQRSPASARIKQLCGNPDAISSAYSLYTYRIADSLGGDAACQRLKEKAARFGIRLASDMVPNHMGIDSEWVVQHPEWFLSLDECPFPSYTFTGPDLSSNENVVVQIEDHYYDHSDAAVVFRRIDKRSGQTKFIYHGNDGTAMPWNDTAQLNYLDPEVREVVIQTIIEVARRFPIIRFDAAMTLAKKHIQRLWYPEPGSGGAIPSRSDFAISRADFDRSIPREFWREVVERIEAEVPDTLLLAEAFWLMEGYFVRTLGMHRVYNSAFMHMLRDEDNSGYRTLIKNTLEFEPEILKRYVNFMNNPDERTAVEQFGSGDKYFGICTLMATLPGLPMFGHGQMEGFTEKYGMEYKKALYDEQADENLMRRHEFEIYPLLYRRELFAGVGQFRLYDFLRSDGQVDQNVFAFTNRLNDQKTLVVFNNRYEYTRGKIKFSVSQSTRKGSGKNRINADIVSALGIGDTHSGYLRFHDLSTGLDYIRSVGELRDRGFEIDLNGYEHHVFVDFIFVHSDAYQDYDRLYAEYGHNGIVNVDQALFDLRLQPVLSPLRAIVNRDFINQLYEVSQKSQTRLSSDFAAAFDQKTASFLTGVKQIAKSTADESRLKKEIQKGFEFLVRLPQLEKMLASPATGNIARQIKAMNLDKLKDKSRWFTLASWVAVSHIGKIASVENDVATSQGWVEDWKLAQPLREALLSEGIHGEQQHNVVTALSLAVIFQDWYERHRASTTQKLLREWFASPEVQIFLKVNRFDGKLWYDADAFQEFLWWMGIIAILQDQTRTTASRVSLAETLVGSQRIIKSIRQLDKKSGCQVELLVSGKKG